MHYSTIDKEEVFVQKGKNNVKLLMFRTPSAQFIINDSGVIALNSILSHSCTDDVLADMKKEYPNVDEKVLEHDVNDILNILMVYNVVVVDDCETNNVCSGCAALDEQEYQVASRMICENLHKNQLNMGATESYYTAINIRGQIINNLEFFYVHKNLDGRINAVVSAFPNFQSSTIVIPTIVFEKNVTEELAKEILGQLLEHVKNSMINKVHKMRIVITEEQEKMPKDFVKLITDVGFEVETILEKEVNNKNTYFYTMKYV